MFTALLDKQGKIIFSQSGKADHVAMTRDAQSSGINQFDIVELSDAEHTAKIKAQTVVTPTASLQDVIAELSPEIQAKIAARLANRGRAK